MSFPDDIDPKRLNLDPQPKRRRRKRRDRPEPAASLKADQPKVEARLRRMPLSPGIMLEPRKDGAEGWVHTAPHSNWELWDAQIHALFGSRSRSVVRVFIDQLKRLCRLDWDDKQEDWKTSERELNAVLGMIADIQPRNSTEAALAAQMVASHLLAMRLAEQAFNRGGMVMETDAALASKLMRTYTMQLETLRSLRGGRKPTVRQAITVKRETHYHQHKHVHDHRGVPENQGECDATDGGTIRAAGADMPQERPALPGPEEAGRVVPITGRSRKGAL